MELQQQDENSRQVIETALDQCLMVEAAAGTGKTTSIVARMVNLIAEGVCPATHLAAVTFTRKAAAELRQRFTEALQQRLVEYQQQPASLSGVQRSRLDRLTAASQLIGQLSIETIHSFCARMIRERPVEFGVDPAFGQLDAETESSIRRAAWEQNLAELKSAGDPLLGQLAEVGLRSGQLRQCFDNFLNFRDISDWPIVAPQPFDIEACRHRVEEYLQHIRQTVRSFLPGRRDELMARYEQVDRFSLRMDASPRILFELLELFERSPDITQKCWPNGTANKGAVPKAELARFKQFRNEVVEPALKYWRQYRYQFVVRFVCRAVETYHHLKATSSGLDFTDLLLITANGLRQQPHLRRYFQNRFSHLLVDEFQDTDPIQAEIVALLGSEDVHETNWQACRLRPGSLFIVGDPKQSIYRFRRGDIITYNHTKALFIRSGGRVVLLSRNFRSSAELIAWNNEVFSDIFQATADTHDAVTPHSPMFSGKARTVRGELSGVAKLAVPDKLDAPIEWEAEQVARFIRQAIDRKLTIEVPKPGTDDQWQLRAVTAADFLILMRNKRHMGQYQLALERLQLECDIAGNNALDSLAELRVLHLCTQAVDDPYNPVHYLSLLRDQLFGFDDAQLYELKRAGGSFQFTAQLPSSLEESLRERFARVNQLLMDSQLWLRMLPPATALTKIATALGLLASAAAGTDGNLALGTMLKAIEMIRHRSWQFDCAADVISAIEDLLESDEIEGVSARASSGDAVRLMNLHKAKGLEAPIVLLVDASKRTEFAPRHYIARTGDRRWAICGSPPRTSFKNAPWRNPAVGRTCKRLKSNFKMLKKIGCCMSPPHAQPTCWSLPAVPNPRAGRHSSITLRICLPLNPSSMALSIRQGSTSPHGGTALPMIPISWLP